MKQGFIDPHFDDNARVISPIDRFLLTKIRVVKAKKFIKMLRSEV